ncbi:20579_t:CDS:2, partial [Racocetra persica]
DDGDRDVILSSSNDVSRNAVSSNAESSNAESNNAVSNSVVSSNAIISSDESFSLKVLENDKFENFAYANEANGAEKDEHEAFSADKIVSQYVPIVGTVKILVEAIYKIYENA